MSKELTEEGTEIRLDDAPANKAPTATSGTTKESGAKRLLRLLGVLASPLYGLGARRGRRRGMAARDARGRPACAVVSVGGMTVGGAGKTPVAARLARGFAKRGFRTVLASRGYRGLADEAVTVVSDGQQVLAFAESAGDEALVLAAHAAGVPVLVGADRLRVAHHAVSVFAAEIIVLDDGFQHHALARDFDVVCIDAHAALGNGRVLPAGPLRESAASLRFADAVIWLDDQGSAPLPDSIRERLRDGISVHVARRAASKLHLLGDVSPLDLDSLQGKRVGLVSGIARPNSFRRSAEALGATVVRELRFRDHHAFRAEDLAPLREDDREEPTDLWLTTEKDALKILPKWVRPAVLQVLEIEAEIEAEDALLDEIEEVLRGMGRLGRTRG